MRYETWEMAVVLRDVFRSRKSGKHTCVEYATVERNVSYMSVSSRMPFYSTATIFAAAVYRLASTLQRRSGAEQET